MYLALLETNTKNSQQKQRLLEPKNETKDFFIAVINDSLKSNRANLKTSLLHLVTQREIWVLQKETHTIQKRFRIAYC